MGVTEGPFLASYTVDVNTCLVSAAVARVERVFTLSDVTDIKKVDCSLFGNMSLASSTASSCRH